jgi:peptide-methionine (S)-S-oxide reductase
MSLFSRSTNDALDASQALRGHPDAVVLTDNHAVLGTPMQGPFPEGLEQIVFGMGCYWGAERMLWQVPGVYTTAVGYAGGFTPNPTYRETCTGRTGHTEAVLVVFDPTQVSVEDLLRVFWEGHDPTQKNRQGNDVGTQYRSGLYTTTPEQLATAQASRARTHSAPRTRARSRPRSCR